VFRRSRPGAGEAPAGDAADGETPAAGTTGTRPHAVTAGKGRPTPKRSEAERRRRQPYAAPRDRKEAGRVTRTRQREDRARRMEAMRRGEEWAMPLRDRGPAKALTRDFVDSKRRFSEFYMYGLLVLLVLLFARFNGLIINALVLVAVLLMLVEGIFISRRARALIAQRLPGESTRGVGLYAAMRALQIRRLRVPKPRIKPGDPY
jgi:hypothetical protein